jgi:hypothetical protein
MELTRDVDTDPYKAVIARKLLELAGGAYWQQRGGCCPNRAAGVRAGLGASGPAPAAFSSREPTLAERMDEELSGFGE